MNKEDCNWYKSKGICTHCCKAMACIGKTMCAECLDKVKEAAERTRSESSKEQRRQQVKLKRRRCIEQGICRECLKKKATVGLKCLECHVKEVKRNESKRTKVKRNMRVELGLCYFCGGKALDGYKVCDIHLKICKSNIGKWDRDNSNHIWRKIQAGEINNLRHWVMQHGVT